jgi:hypothetical protein
MTFLGALAALTGSRWVLYAVALLAAGVGYEAWKYHERSVGASKFEAKITQKADANAKQAETVREAVAAGKPGRDDPWRVRDR